MDKYVAKTFPDYARYRVNEVGQPRQTELRINVVFIKNSKVRSVSAVEISLQQYGYLVIINLYL